MRRERKPNERSEQTPQQPARVSGTPSPHPVPGPGPLPSKSPRRHRSGRSSAVAGPNQGVRIPIPSENVTPTVRDVFRYFRSRLEAEPEQTPAIDHLITQISLELIPHPHHSEESEVGRSFCEVHNDLAASINDIMDVAAIGTLGIGAPAIGEIGYLPEGEPMGQVFPEWVEVNDLANDPAILEGTVAGVAELLAGTANEETLPHVSHDDFPASHYTHDYNCSVTPDVTDDERYTNLIGFKTLFGADPCKPQRDQLQRVIEERLAAIDRLGANPHRHPGLPRPISDDNGAPPPQLTQEEYDRAIAEINAEFEPEINRLKAQLDSQQCQVPSWQVKSSPNIGTEWEIGLGASNDGNICAKANRAGSSAGFYSAGHERGDTIWNWPTVGDHLHVEGLWIWDRGHPPASTEMHPPRLVAIQRRLPDILELPEGIDVPRRKLLATRVDIFASGDGGALYNNRAIKPYVKAIHMSDFDYVFTVHHKIPQPSPSASLAWWIEDHSGHSFRASPQIVSDATGVHVTIPWHSSAESDHSVYTQTLWLYWKDNTDFGVPRDYLSQTTAVKVTLDRVVVRDHSHSAAERFLAPGRRAGYRIFVDVGGQWLFLNDLVSARDILNDGLGNSDDGKAWNLNRSFTVYVPPPSSEELIPGYRVHAGGWLAGGVDNIMGRIINPESSCSDIGKWANDNLFTLSVLRNGAADQPLGVVNKFYSANNAFGLQPHAHSVDSTGVTNFDNEGFWQVDLNRQFTLDYHIEAVPIGS